MLPNKKSIHLKNECFLLINQKLKTTSAQFYKPLTINLLYFEMFQFCIENKFYD